MQPRVLGSSALTCRCPLTIVVLAKMVGDAGKGDERGDVPRGVSQLGQPLRSAASGAGNGGNWPHASKLQADSPARSNPTVQSAGPEPKRIELAGGGRGGTGLAAAKS
jgi:hypothetical protein